MYWFIQSLNNLSDNNNNNNKWVCSRMLCNCIDIINGGIYTLIFYSMYVLFNSNFKDVKALNSIEIIRLKLNPK